MGPDSPPEVLGICTPKDFTTGRYLRSWLPSPLRAPGLDALLSWGHLLLLRSPHHHLVSSPRAPHFLSLARWAGQANSIRQGACSKTNGSSPRGLRSFHLASSLQASSGSALGEGCRSSLVWLQVAREPMWGGVCWDEGR